MTYDHMQHNKEVNNVSSLEVTQLRKEGRYREAYEKGKLLMQNPKSTVWDFRAMGHALVALKKKDPLSFNSLLSEVINYASQVIYGLNKTTGTDFLKQNMNADSADSYLAKNLFIICEQQVNGKALAQAAVYEKQGDYACALQCYADALQQGKLTPTDEEHIAWTIFRNVEVLLKNPKSNFNFIINSFSLFFSLSQLKKPSLVNSLIFGCADRLAQHEERFHYAEFLATFNIDTLRSEDYYPTESKQSIKLKEPHVYEALYYKALRHCAKNTILRLNRNEYIDKDALNYCYKLFSSECNVYIKLIQDNAAEAHNDTNKNRLWTILYTAKILLKIGLQKQGISLAMQIVKLKTSEYWAWLLLARLYAGEDDFKALCCWCKTFSCKPPESPGMHAEFAELLHAMGNNLWASEEIKEARTLIESMGLKEPSLLVHLENSVWYRNALQDYDKKTLLSYEQYASQAEELLYSSLPWFKAIIGKKIWIQKESGKKVRRELYLFLDETEKKLPLQLLVPDKKFAEFVEDSSLWVRVLPENPNVTDKIEIVSVKSAGDQTWHLPCRTAIINYFNKDKKKYSCVISYGILSYFPASLTKKKLYIGCEVGVVICSKKPKAQVTTTDLKEVCHVVKVTEPEAPADPDLKKHSDTTISSVVNSGSAFTEDNIFIPSELVKRAQLEKGDYVEVDAILNFNTVRSEWAYRAYRVEKIESNI